MMNSSITLFYEKCGIFRTILAFIGYITPSVILLTLLAFYDPKTTVCYSFESTFLLDNTRPPSFTSVSANGKTIEDFQSFHAKFFSDDPSGQNYSQNYFYHYYDDDYNYTYHLDSIGVEKGLSWNQYLENLSISNKYLLLKSLGIKTRKTGYGTPSGDYYYQILTSFKSVDFIENVLSLIREFGFLNFCLEESMLNPPTASADFSFSFVDFFEMKGDSWWRGYSPYDVDYSDDFDILLDALLIFEADRRFSRHIACLAKIFGVEQNVIYRDFSRLKNLKTSKTSSVVRRGEYSNGTFSFHFSQDFKDSAPSGEKIVLKLYTAAFDSFRLEFDEFSACESRFRQYEFITELSPKAKTVLEEEFNKGSRLRYSYSLSKPTLIDSLIL